MNEHRCSYWYQLRWLNFRDSRESLTALQYEPGDGIYLHFWRDPVLTIISAFFYHLESEEVWTTMPFKIGLFKNAAKFFDHSADPQRIYEIYKAATWTFDVDSEPPIWRFRLNDHQITGMWLISLSSFILFDGIKESLFDLSTDDVDPVAGLPRTD